MKKYKEALERKQLSEQKYCAAGSAKVGISTDPKGLYSQTRAAFSHE